ncbi:hypothetical protein [Paraburkholderia phenoliruptrix]|uniref:hypothetical protein n=1 Tax=Paraburkholderia phenoliruptrix TaxID=252970 RepID=UPI0034D01E30
MTKRLLLLKASTPSEGQRIEFSSDRYTDKGPATGTIERVKLTVDGIYLTVRFADGQQTVSWDDISGDARRSDGMWMIKAQRPDGWRKPTPAQAAAGNYKKPRMTWHGLKIAIENPKGTVREGVDETGKAWRTVFEHAYGEISGTEGVDGDPVDVYLGPDESAEQVYIVRQMKRKRWDQYDEDKCMLNFPSLQAAKDAYMNHYDDPRFFGGIIAMPVEEFVAKVRATRDKPAMIKSIVVLRAH